MDQTSQHQVLICWFSVELYKNTFVIVRTCLYSDVLTLDFHSEYFTSTVHVFTCQAVPYQTVWIIYHSPQLCWFANAKINLFFLSTLAPDRAPTILSVTPHTTTSVLVRWQVVGLLVLWTEEWMSKVAFIGRSSFWFHVYCSNIRH